MTLAEIDAGQRPGANEAERVALKELRKATKELRRASDIWPATARIIGAEPDRRSQKSSRSST